MHTAPAHQASTPTAALLAFFKSHGRACVCDASELQARALELVARGRALLDQGHLPVDQFTQLKHADQVSALCAEALYTVNGFGAVSSGQAFAGVAALEVLAAELELSEATSGPLHELRARVSALAAGGEAQPMDPFLAFQAPTIARALLGWTESFVTLAPYDDTAVPERFHA